MAHTLPFGETAWDRMETIKVRGKDVTFGLIKLQNEGPDGPRWEAFPPDYHRCDDVHSLVCFSLKDFRDRVKSGMNVEECPADCECRDGEPNPSYNLTGPEARECDECGDPAIEKIVELGWHTDLCHACYVQYEERAEDAAVRYAEDQVEYPKER